MQINVDDSVCWICGEKFKGNEELARTTHHSLPTHLKPVKNILVPVHESCHDKINKIDFAGIKAFAYKIAKSQEDNGKQVSKLLEIVESFEQLSIRDIIKEKENEQKEKTSN